MYARQSPARITAPVRFGCVAADNGRLLGRRAELAAVDEALEELERRRGTVIAFSGEGGIGKTRLLDELGERAGARGHLVLSGRASELERELPFGVWEDALAEHAEFLGVDRLERLVGDQLPELAAVLPTVGQRPGRPPGRALPHAPRRPRAAGGDRAAPGGRRRARRPPVGRRRVAGAGRAPAAAAAARAGRARARVPPRARSPAARHGAGHRRARRLGDRAHARRAVVRRRRGAARRRRPRAGPRRDLRGRRRQPVLPAATRAPARRRAHRRRRAVRRRRPARGRAGARAGDRGAQRGRPRGWPRAPPWPATRSTSTSRCRPPRWRRARRWRRSTSCWRARC